MIDLVRKRYPSPAWVVLAEVANATGGNIRRRADALAFSVWPSNGYDLHGFEFKASRSDLVRELDDPTKADAVGKYCDYWWLVVADKKLVDAVEVPATWGILAPAAGVLRMVRKAPKREKQPWSAGFVAALMRQIVEERIHVSQFRALELKHAQEIEAKAAEEVELQTKDKDRQLRHARDQYEQLVRVVRDFEQASGVHLAGYNAGNIARAVQLVLDATRMAEARRLLPTAIHHLQRVKDGVDRLVGQLEHAQGHLTAYVDGNQNAPLPNPNLQVPYIDEGLLP